MSAKTLARTLAWRLRRLVRPPGGILVLDDVPPSRDFGAGMPRALEILRLLVAEGFAVRFLPMDAPWAPGAPTPDLPDGIDVLRDRSKADLEVVLSDGVETLLVSRPHNMRLLRVVLDRRPDLKPARLIYDAEAVFANRTIRQAEVLGSPLTEAEAEAAIAEEVGLARLADRVTAVTAAEAAQFSASGCPRVHVLADAPDAAPTPRAFGERRDILFVGRLAEEGSPNVDSIHWFTTAVLSRLAERLRPAPRLILVGRDAAPSIRALDANPLVQRVGAVPDLAPWYDRARIFVAPTRFAAGLPRKVLESAAAGLPVVGTSLLAAQIGWRDASEMLTADEPEPFVAACIRLYKDEALWLSLRAAALVGVERHFTRQALRRSLIAALA
ncbi:MAG TPA: glycosyltransferase family 4 protein [Beijerinckiaceae bacterium]